jgi:hypothetical protein
LLNPAAQRSEGIVAQGKGGGKHSKVPSRRPPPLLSLPLIGVGSGKLPRRLFDKTKGGGEEDRESESRRPATVAHTV